MWFLIVLVSPLVLLILSFFLRLGIEYLHGHKLPKRRPRPKRSNFFKRIFWDFPKALVGDMMSRNPDDFREYGLHLICGEQGSGKTVTLAYLLRYYQQCYPKLKVATNFCYRDEDGSISHWSDLVFNNNGKFGQIDVLDEIQNWFSSMQSKDFPPAMLQEITQQRKQSKMIFGTAQVFGRVAKPIREQVNLLYLPMTLFGCLTIIRVYKPKMTNDGNIKKAKLRKLMFFVHDEDLRNSYDTYKKISQLAKDGFIPDPFSASVDQTITIVNPKNKKDK